MKLWRKAAGTLKDKNSIWLAALSTRNTDVETAVIRATSHDAFLVDYKNTRRVFQWLRMSPSSLKPIVSAISRRMQRTRSWAVALKGLILVHCLFGADGSAAVQIGRLPFDLSEFTDRHERSSKSWGYTAFVRLYYNFLDHRAAHFSSEAARNRPICSTGDELVRLHKWQILLDMILRVRPPIEGVVREPVREAMDCIIMEVFDLYGGICGGVAKVLAGALGKMEAEMALRVVKKAVLQSDRLGLYFQWCREVGILSSSQLPKMERISEVDIRELERVISGGCDEDLREKGADRKLLETVVTDVWEVFDDDLSIEEDMGVGDAHFQRELPDLISF